MAVTVPSNKVEWDVLHRLEVDGRVLSVAFSPDGRLLASASYFIPPEANADIYTNAVIIWDVASGKELRRIGNLKDWATWVSFSPDARLLGWGSADYTIHLLEIASGKELACFKGYGGHLFSASFSPDGRLLASGSEIHDVFDRSIVLREVPSGQEIKRLNRRDNGTHWSVAFSPGGLLLASGSNPIGQEKYDYGSLVLWNLYSGKDIKCLTGHKSWITSVSFSPDGRLLATGSYDHTVRLWEVSSGRELRTLVGHKQWVYRASFSSDRKTLISAAIDEMPRFWDVSSGNELHPIIGHPESATSVSLSPDGQFLATGNLLLPNTILIWKAEPSIEWLVDYFKQRGQVDADLMEKAVHRYRNNGRLAELADALKENGFFEEAAKIYDDLGQAPTKPKSESTQRPRESKPSSGEADSTKSVCPSCDSEIKANWLECPECGASLKEKVCHNCGERLEPHWTRCPACRTTVGGSGQT